MYTLHSGGCQDAAAPRGRSTGHTWMGLRLSLDQTSLIPLSKQIKSQHENATNGLIINLQHINTELKRSLVKASNEI